jgi:hypothetical protein
MKSAIEQEQIIDVKDFGAVIVEMHEKSATLKSGGVPLGTIAEIGEDIKMMLESSGRLVAQKPDEDPIESLAAALEFTLNTFQANDPGKHMSVSGGNREIRQSLEAVQLHYGRTG